MSICKTEAACVQLLESQTGPERFKVQCEIAGPAYEKFPKNPTIAAYYTGCLVRAHDEKTAFKIMGDLRKQGIDHPYFYVNEAIIASLRGDLKAEISACQIGIKKFPDHSKHCHWHIASAFFDQGKVDQSVETYFQGIYLNRSKPEESEGLFALFIKMLWQDYLNQLTEYKSNPSLKSKRSLALSIARQFGYPVTVTNVLNFQGMSTRGDFCKYTGENCGMGISPRILEFAQLREESVLWLSEVLQKNPKDIEAKEAIVYLHIIGRKLSQKQLKSLVESALKEHPDHLVFQKLDLVIWDKKSPLAVNQIMNQIQTVKDREARLLKRMPEWDPDRDLIKWAAQDRIQYLSAILKSKTL